jgi:hypothetical protein
MGLPDPAQLRILDDAQRAKLAAIQSIFGDGTTALAIETGLIEPQNWIGNLCFYGFRSNKFAAELDLTDAQIRQFQRMWETAVPKGSKPPRDEALAVLNEQQRARIAALEKELSVAKRAVELRLMASLLGESLCH